MGFVGVLSGAALALALASAGCGPCGDAVCEDVRAHLVFNEVSGAGEDFAELYNTGTTDLDVSGYALASSDSHGYPQLNGAVRFPSGTVVRAGNYLLVVLGGECPVVGSGVVCLRGTFGVSNSNGESLFVLEGSDRTVLAARYPANAAPSGWSWGRIPNGTGSFSATRATPGAANRE